MLSSVFQLKSAISSRFFQKNPPQPIPERRGNTYFGFESPVLCSRSHAGENPIVCIIENLLRGEFGKGALVIESHKDLGFFDAEFERNVFC